MARNAAAAAAETSTGFNAVTVELAKRFKSYKTIIVDNALIPVNDGKVTVSEETRDQLLKGGYLK